MSRLLCLLLFPVVLSADILSDVSVIDVRTGQIAPHRDVVIRGDRIAAVRRSASPGGHAKRVRYVIPGLWDMDVRLSARSAGLASYVSSGITGVRETTAKTVRPGAWEPRIYNCGAALPGLIRTPAEARQAFNRYYDRRVDFIWTGDIPSAAFEALAEASRHDGIPFAGELPWSVSAFEAARDRMVSMERLYGIALACSRKEDELRARRLAAAAGNDRTAVGAIDEEIAETYDPRRAAELWDLFRRYDVRQTPVLTAWSQANAPECEFAMKLTHDMAQAGVSILAGSGGNEPRALAGELTLLVKAGLTPAQALRSATIEPARLMHRERLLGELKPGFEADLVVLDANPLTDIANVRRIDSVYLHGRRVHK